MQIKNLTKKDHKHVKSLLLSLDFLAIRTFLIDRNAYTSHNRFVLLLEILLMGDYRTASDIIEMEALSPADYITIAKFGDDDVFDFALFALSDEDRPKLALTLINNFDKTFDIFEKCESIIKLKAIDEAVLKALCVEGREEILKYFLAYLDFCKNQEDYASILQDLANVIISDNNLSHLQMLLKYTKLSDEEVLHLGHDQFAWYASNKQISDSLIENIFNKVDVFRFKVIIKVKKLKEKQIEDLFKPDYFPLFCTFVVENSLAEKLEKKLYTESNGKYLAVYLKYHRIGLWKYIKYNLFK